jgi:MarR family transcriptional regulator, organic hydroperoxide resistance regulator
MSSYIEDIKHIDIIDIYDTIELKELNVPDTNDIDEIIRLHWSILTAMQFSSRPDWMELEMTMAQIKALFTISYGDAVPVNSIAEYLGVGQPTASHLVDKLVRQGFADRSESPTDRRVTLVRLTSLGEDLVRRLYQGGEEQYRAWVSKLTNEERKDLLSGLQALARVASVTAAS